MVFLRPKSYSNFPQKLKVPVLSTTFYFAISALMPAISQQPMPQAIIIALATAWGPKFGGINAFNTELLKSLGILPGRAFRLLCVVEQTNLEECADAKCYGVELLALRQTLDQAALLAAQHCQQLLQTAALDHTAPIIFLGHDDKTGPLALALRDLLPKSHAVLLHHMAHGAYQSYKKGISLPALEKDQMQREMFICADLCFAVGPLLQNNLLDLFRTAEKAPEVRMLVPGLDIPAEAGIKIADKTPNNFTAFVAGRLSAEDDRIKQGTLALRGFGLAAKEAATQDVHIDNALRNSPRLRMRGVRASEEKDLRKLLLASAERQLEPDFADYTDDRAKYYQSLASSSVALMPSWHEGFGLTAWEAIACALPVVIGEQSGVYRLLHDKCSGMGIAPGQSVRVVNVAGNTPDQGGEFNHTDQDVDHIKNQLLNLGGNMTLAKQRATQLRVNLLTCFGYDWKGCASELCQSASEVLNIVLLAEIKPVPVKPIRHYTTDSIETFVIPDWLRLPAKQIWRADLQLPPSKLLLARDEIVPFDPVRQPELIQLSDWTNNPSLIDVQLISGNGGSGKTRLGFALARQLQNRWHSLWLNGDLPTEWASQWAQLMLKADKPLLLVIDYAETRQETVIALLNTALAQAQSQSTDLPKLRLLLLARSSQWWQALPNHEQCDASVAAWLAAKTRSAHLPLPIWQANGRARLHSYNAAIAAFADALGLPQVRYVPDLKQAMYARPLYLHLSALAALDGQRPNTADALLEQQLRHEWRYWHKMHGAQLCDYEEWADAMAWLVLRQEASVFELTLALPQIGVTNEALPAAMQRSYRLSNAKRDALTSLQPDLLAECLLRQRLAQARGAEILALVLRVKHGVANALSVLGRLCASAEAPSTALCELTSWQQVLVAELASAWPRLGTKLVDAAHFAQAGLGGLLPFAWELLSSEEQVNLAKQLEITRYSTNLLRLRPMVARVQVQLVNTPTARATVLNNLAICLNDLGDAASRTEAIACTREALAEHQKSPKSQPANIEQTAILLNNLANFLSKLGSPAALKEALICSRKSVKICRKLPRASRINLNMALNTLSALLVEQGGTIACAEAIKFSRETVKISRKLTLDGSIKNRLVLADALINLSSSLAKRNDKYAHDECGKCAREAVDIYRELTSIERASYLPDLATAIGNLANHLIIHGNTTTYQEGLNFAREAVAIGRELTQLSRSSFLPELAMHLDNLAKDLRLNHNNTPEALIVAAEAVENYRELVDSHPLSYLPGLASALNALANLLKAQDDVNAHAQALAHASESLTIYLRLSTQMPDKFNGFVQISANVFNSIAQLNGLDPEAELHAVLSKTSLPDAYSGLS